MTSVSRQSLQEQLRQACAILRTKSMPLSDFISLLQQAADRIDRLEFEQTFSAAELHCARVFNNN